MTRRLLFAIATILGLCTTSVAQAEPVTLRVWDYPRWPSSPEGVDRYHWLEGRLAEFERTHPDVQIDFTRLTWSYGADKVRVATLAGVGPDVVAGAPMTEFIARGLVEPVDAYLTPEDRSDYLPSALQAFTWQDRTWGWPWYQTGSVVVANADLFRSMDLDLPPDGRWTRSEFEGLLLRLSNPDRNPPVFGLGYAVGDSLAAWPLLLAGEDPTPQSSAAMPSTERLSLGVTRLRGYRRSGWTPPGSGGLLSNPIWEAFATHQRVGVMPVGVWAIPALRNRADLAFTVLHYPDDAAPYVAVSGWTVLRSHDDRRRDAAMALARFLANTESQTVLHAYGVFPTRKSTGDIYIGDPEMSRAAEVLASGRPIPLHPRWSQLEREVGSAIQAALTAEADDLGLLTSELERIAREAGREVRMVETATAPRERRLSGTVIGMCIGGGLGGAFVLTAGRRRAWRYALCVAPAAVLLGGLMLWPLVWSGMLSFAEFDVGRGWIGDWVGVAHYQSLTTLPAFRAALRNTIVYTVIVVPAQVVIALVLASLIAPLGEKSRAWFRGAFYLPGVTSVVVLSLIWQWLFNEEAGALNAVLGFWGFGAVRWLSDPDIALGSIVLMTLARPPGGPILIYLAAIDSVPRGVLDAAAIDGSTGWRRWWEVVVPLVKPTTTFLLVTALIGSFQVFAPIYVMTDGGPGNATTVLVHQIYTTAMRNFDFGRASAMAVVLTLLLVGAAAWQTRRRTEALEY